MSQYPGRSMSRSATHLWWGLLSAITLAIPVGAVPPGYTEKWHENFDGAIDSTPNPQVWAYNTGWNGGWGNEEWQTYVDSPVNCQIKDDWSAVDARALRIRAENDGNGNWYSARIFSISEANRPLYGYIEGRLRIPRGKGIWPAFWMLGDNLPSANWPGCGELDIMEILGHEPWKLYGSFHASGWDGQGIAYGDFGNGYHTYAMNWTPNCISFYVDDQLYVTKTNNDSYNWPFNQRNFFILNLAIGGKWPGYPDASTPESAEYFVDYIRAYRLSGVPSNKTVSLFSLANNKFVCADNGGSSALTAIRTAVGDWEKFQVVDLGWGNVALKSLANNRYVCAENGGASALLARSTEIGAWETFAWEAHEDGTVSLRSAANNQYVSTDLSSGTYLISNRSTPGGWESYCVTTY
jgi:beta-glucanase (GH16 family)